VLDTLWGSLSVDEGDATEETSLAPGPSSFASRIFARSVFLCPIDVSLNF